MYKLNVTKNAQEQLEQIVRYILFILLSPQTANNFTNKVEQKYVSICKNPYIYPEKNFGYKKYRYAMVGKYMIIFRIDEQTKTVQVIAIGHSLQKRKNIIKRK